MDKGIVTNGIAAAVTAVGLLLPASPYRDAVLATGLFALSGALTNWLAVTMLFERIPGLYGSGVVPARFEEFKGGIRSLILENFFTEENFERLTEKALEEDLDLGGIAEGIRYSDLFDGLVDSIRASKLGGVLSIVGGVAVLDGLRDPFEREMRKRVSAILGNSRVREVVAHGMSTAGLRRKVEVLVDTRLAELTPAKVKEIVQKMIRRHLGWLIVWGGVFGGIIGLAASALL